MLVGMFKPGHDPTLILIIRRMGVKQSVVSAHTVEPNLLPFVKIPASLDPVTGVSTELHPVASHGTSLKLQWHFLPSYSESATSPLTQIRSHIATPWTPFLHKRKEEKGRRIMRLFQCSNKKQSLIPLTIKHPLEHLPGQQNKVVWQTDIPFFFFFSKELESDLKLFAPVFCHFLTPGSSGRVWDKKVSKIFLLFCIVFSNYFFFSFSIWRGIALKLFI